MAKQQYGKRVEKKVAAKARVVGRDVKRGVDWAGAKLVKGTRTVGRDAKRAGKVAGRDIEKGGKRIGSATRRSLVQASDRIKARTRARTKKA
jgi:hypothetical protein